MMQHKLEINTDKTAVVGNRLILFVMSDRPLPSALELAFIADGSSAQAHPPHYLAPNQSEVIIHLPVGSGVVKLHDAGRNPLGELQITPSQIAQWSSGGTSYDDDTDDGSGRHARVVRLARTGARFVNDERLWEIIKRIADGLSLPRFTRFVDLAFCDDPRDGFETKVKDALVGSGELLQESGAFFRVDSYDRLKLAAEIFLLANASVVPPTDLSLIDRSQDDAALNAYIGADNTLPYLRIIYDRLGIPAPALLNATKVTDQVQPCREVLERNSRQPCFIELIWSYWHEEAMQVQAMAAITQRFQNRRAPGARDPLAALEIDPLRPLNHLLWRHTQTESDRLSVLRRAHEYEHEYGFPLHGRAVASLRSADRRSKFLEAFHNLLHRAVLFYKEDDDTTHVADGFPVLNALKETHYVLSQGAHNQFGDLPATARQEMLIEQWLLGRSEMREFLGSRPMVAYPEAWMDRVDTIKTLKGWTDVSVVHFHDLAVFGEQLLLSIRWGAWSTISEPVVGKQWARAWRPEIQGYVHAIRATLGIDLGAELISARDETERYLPPSVHLRRRLSAQASPR